MTTQEFKIEGYVLTVIPDRGFYLVDDAGCTIIDASVLGSNWPVEIQCTGREFYIKTDTSVQEVSFGISQRTQ